MHVSMYVLQPSSNLSGNVGYLKLKRGKAGTPYYWYLLHVRRACMCSRYSRVPHPAGSDVVRKQATSRHHDRLAQCAYFLVA